MVIKGGYCIGGQPSSRHQRETNVPAGTLALVRSPQALRCSKEQNALHTLIHQRHLTPSCGGRAPTAERTLKIKTGGTKGGNGGGYFVTPTVITDTKPNMKVVREEIFGPVLVVESFDDNDLDRIAKQANDTVYGLAASVWTRDGGLAHKMAKRLRAGTVWINCHNVFDASLPFGGYKQSGWGREMGEEVLHNYTEIKAVTTAL